MFHSKVVVITGGAGGIGRCIAEEFRKAGAIVCVIDIQENEGYTGDVGNEAVLRAFANRVISEHGHVDVLVNNAPPPMLGLDTCSYAEFSYALQVGVTAAFYLCKLFSAYFSEGASVINISSTRDRMSQAQSESYAAAKGGLSALTHALAVSFAGRVRVNSVSPGWMDTDFREYTGPDAAQQPVGRVGNPMDVANAVLFLASDKAGFITGENLCMDGGMTRQMIYHGEHGWQYGPETGQDGKS